MHLIRIKTNLLQNMHFEGSYEPMKACFPFFCSQDHPGPDVMYVFSSCFMKLLTIFIHRIGVRSREHQKKL